MSFLCGSCGNTSFYLKSKGAAVGMYCDACGKWFKWVGKKELESLKRRGAVVYAQNVDVKLKGVSNGAVSFVNGPISTNMGIVSDDEAPFDVEKEKENFEETVEKEVERRLAERVKEKEKDVKKENKVKKEDSENDQSDFCPYCSGTPLESEGNSKISVSIYSGVLAITDEEGLNIYGMYKLKRCPFCGKIF